MYTLTNLATHLVVFFCVDVNKGAMLDNDDNDNKQQGLQQL